ncbi:helix-turn-helix domain-containing protein [Actinomadura macrotermitis]|uniref:HTH cro/C1-type domain-containing protein n=1 Tax=Actinomadura macrotermitis TaxID=2585200 RepID=A0A7K0BYY0_9ACTN|nr:helix-turn-helix transcriptional regulator [Actinomadura macrotermitis]MQY05864.1 hypothetical protein [Actinomadura macrotermitis]
MTAAKRDDDAPASRFRLAAELRGLRELAGLSGRDLARLIDISQSQVSRIESGKSLPTLPQVREWAKAVGASPEARAWLLVTAETVRTESSPWPAALAGRPHLQDEIKEQEARTRESRCFQPSLVPGLLQTAEYARRVFEICREIVYNGEGLAAAVAGRLDRQLALYDPERRFQFLITESALRWRPGSVPAQLAQLDRIASLSTLENVSIGLIPLRVPALTYFSHGFVIFAEDEEREQDAFVTLETIHANTVVHDPEDIRLYEDRWSLLRQMAVFDEEARTFLAEIADEIRRSAP